MSKYWALSINIRIYWLWNQQKSLNHDSTQLESDLGQSFFGSFVFFTLRILQSFFSLEKSSSWVCCKNIWCSKGLKTNSDSTGSGKWVPVIDVIWFKSGEELKWARNSHWDIKKLDLKFLKNISILGFLTREHFSLVLKQKRRNSHFGISETGSSDF